MRSAGLLLAMLSLPPTLAGTGGGAGLRPGPPPRSAFRPVPAVADSEEVLDGARAAQRRFERIRRRYLPRVPYSHGRCQERIGRFCLYHDAREPDLPVEPVAILEARAELSSELDRAAAEIPGDRWIQGQRVRYRIEAGEPEVGLAIARRCPRPDDDSWCDALLGYALHALGRFERAESAFSRALSRMPPEERCRWEDLSPILEGRGRDRYGDLECDERGPFEEAFWWLADPLRLVPGNDRRTEHYSRYLLERLLEDAANGYGVGWGSDLGEVVLRYGWPVAWELAWRRSPGLRTDASVQGRDPPGARHYLPRAEWVARPLENRPDAWELDKSRPRTLYAPPYARPLFPLEHQLAVFQRGKTAILAVAYDLSHDTVPPCDSLRHGLFVPLGRGSSAAATGVARGDGGRLLLAVPPVDSAQDVVAVDDTIVPAISRRWLSLEIHCPAERLAFRARYGVTLAREATNGLALSDLLVLEESDATPESLEAAAAHARGSLRVRSGERLGLYWEVYDSREDAREQGRELEITVALTRRDRSFLRKVVEWAGLAERREQEVGLRWRERLSREGVQGRSVELTLPDLPDGRYRLEVRLASPFGPDVTASTELRVES